MDTRIQINFISSTSVNFHNEVQYYLIQLRILDDTSSPVQDPTISSTPMENEEPAPIDADQNNQEQNQLFQEMERVMMEASALIAELS